MMSIVDDTKVYTDKVRNATYGKEVRSSIADSIDKIAENVKDEIARDTLAADVNVVKVDITELKDNSSFYTKCNKYIKEEKMTNGYRYTTYWGNGAFGQTTATNCKTLSTLIPIVKGVTYYYKRLIANNCKIHYDNGTLASFSTNTALQSDGSFVATNDGVVGLTMELTVTNAIFTSEKIIYDDDIFNEITLINDTSVNSDIDAIKTDMSNKVDKEEINSFVKKVTSYIKEENMTNNYRYTGYWSGTTFGEAEATTCKVLNTLIPIVKGVTYYYKRLNANNCKIHYNNGTVTNFSDVDWLQSQGEFTAEDDGVVGLTIEKTVDNAIFTSEKIIYNDDITEDVYLIYNTSVNTEISNLREKITENDYKYVFRSSLVDKTYKCGYFYNLSGNNFGKGGASDNNTVTVINPVKLKGGKCIAYSGIFAYFTWLKDLTTNTYVRLTNIVNKTDGIFETINDSELYITLNLVSNREPYIYEIEKNIELPYETVTVSTDGTKDFNKITEAVAYAFNRGNVKIHVCSGDYDIISEYGTEDAILATGDGANLGMRVGRNTIIEFEPGAKVICNYTGINTTIQNGLSVFNAWTDECIIDNLQCEASNIRYIIHDEMSANYNYYHHVYKNCDMSFNNTNNPSFTQCIGGGLGHKGYIEVIGGTYNSVASPTTSANITISYHNHAKTEDTTAKSKVVITGVNCNGDITMFHCGKSTLDTNCIVNNCQCNDINVDFVSGHYTENMELITWNNVVRA